MASIFDRIRTLIGGKGSALPPPSTDANTPKVQATTAYGGMGTSLFESAKLSRRRGYIWTPAPQDFRKEMLVGDRLEMLRKSRYLEKNSGFYREYIKSMCLYSVGGGILPQINTDDSAYNETAEDYLKVWMKRCEITGRYNFSELQALICKAMDRDGEIFVLLIKDEDGKAALQVIESHRVGNATANVDRLNDGIQYDAYGRVVSYRIIEDDGNFIDLPADSVLHIYDPEQVSGARGYPPLQHAINHLYDEMELLAMEKQAIKDQSDITRIFRKTNPMEDAGDYPDLGHSNYDDANTAQEFKRNFGGKAMVINQGEELQHLESKRPNSTFTGFLEHLRRDSSQGAMPYEFIADPSKIGGASVRLVVAKADRCFQHRQNILIHRFLEPVINYIIADAIERGELPDNSEWTKMTFTTPCRVTVDAGRMSDQERSDIEFGLGTLSDSYAARGMDAREEIVRKAKELKMINEVAKEHGIDPTSLYKLASGLKATMANPPIDQSRNVTVNAGNGGGAGAPPFGKTDAEGEQEGEDESQEAEAQEEAEEEGESVEGKAEEEVDEEEEEGEDEEEDESNPKPRKRK